MAFVFGYSNLVAANNSTTPNHQVDMTADWIVVDDGSGNTLRIPMTTNINIDKNQSQKSTEPNRRDVAGTISPATWQQQWIYIWAIYNPVTNTIAGLFSLSATAPTLPSGYTHKALVGAVYSQATTGNFDVFSQRGNKVYIAQATVVTAGTATSASPGLVSLAAVIPPISWRVRGHGYCYGNPNICVIQPTATIDLGNVTWGKGAVADSGTFWGNWTIDLSISQTMYYYNNGAGSPASHIYVTGYEI